MLFQVFLNQGEEREEVGRDPQRLMRNRNGGGSLPLLEDDERSVSFVDVAVHCPGERTVRLHEQPGTHDEKIRRCLPDEFHELCRTGRHEDPISPVAQDDFKSRKKFFTFVADQQAFHGGSLAAVLERM
jgi:hypothetical protein